MAVKNLKNIKKDGVIYNQGGAVVTNLYGTDNKHFAVIARCGHCGKGYYVPIVFSIYCKDVQTAIERVKAIGKVKNQNRDVIIDAFEISKEENRLNSALGDYDLYLKSILGKDSPELQARMIMENFEAERLLKLNKENKVYSEDELKGVIRTSDTFAEEYVLQRHIAPTIQGGRLIFPKRFNGNQILEEYFMYEVYKYGVLNGSTKLMTLYYQAYGKNNKLGLVYNDRYFYYGEADGSYKSFYVDDYQYRGLVKSGIFERDEQIEEQKKIEEEKLLVEKHPVSAIDRFNKKMDRYRSLNKNKNDKQMGE